MTATQVDGVVSSICEASTVCEADVEDEIDERKWIVAGDLLVRPELRHVRRLRRSHRGRDRCSDRGCGQRGRRRRTREQSLLRAIDGNSMRRAVVTWLARLMLVRLEYAGSPFP